MRRYLLRALGIAPATSWHPLFQEFRSAPKIMRYDIPELGIKGDMFHALRVMSAILFDLNEETESRIRTTLGAAYSQTHESGGAYQKRRQESRRKDASFRSGLCERLPPGRLGERKRGLIFLSPRMTIEPLRNISPCIPRRA